MMNLAVYRNKETQEITRVHECLQVPIADIEKSIKDFNSVTTRKESVCLRTFDDNSLEAFLYKNRKVRIQDFRESLDEIRSQIDSLSDDLQWLDGLCKEAYDGQKNT